MHGVRAQPVILTFGEGGKLCQARIYGVLEAYSSRKILKI